MLIRILKLEAPPSASDIRYLPEMQPLLDKLRKENAAILYEYSLPEHYSVVIGGICGGVWTHGLDKKQSSTGRERTAQCYAVDKFKPFLAGKVFMVCDNMNSSFAMTNFDLSSVASRN